MNLGLRCFLAFLAAFVLSDSVVKAQEVRRGDSRLIAYMGNWQSCPTAQMLQHYSHVVIAFAVSYTYGFPRNECSITCEIDEPPVCNNDANQALIQELQAAGKKVILSFGGAGMGGSWARGGNDCWEYCFGREIKVVNRLTQIVRDMGLDGVDIDYEYFYEDYQNGSGFTKGTEAQTFLRNLTTGLRDSLGEDSIITHAPLDVDATQGTAYYDVLMQVKDSLDFLMPQYYNGIVRPHADGLTGTGQGSISALDHATDVANDMFDGDMTRVVFGFCITDCSGSTTGAQAASVMTELGTYHSCNGGAFFWLAEDDIGGNWSQEVRSVIQPNEGCSNVTVSTIPPAVSTIPPGGLFDGWHEYGPCCNGVQTRTRDCNIPAPSTNGGNATCDGVALESQACSTDECPDADRYYPIWGAGKCIADGQQRDWDINNLWDTLSRCCLEYFSFELETCMDDGVPVNGNWSSVSWRDCNATCGGGTQKGTRSCTNPAPVNDGANCEGLSIIEQECNTQSCPSPVDGGWSDWSEWSYCSVTCGGGKRIRTRPCKNPSPAHGGSECLGSDLDFDDSCNAHVECAQQSTAAVYHGSMGVVYMLGLALAIYIIV